MLRALLTATLLFATMSLLTGCKNFGPTLTPYTCESGNTVEVKYPSDITAFLYYEGRRYRLRADEYSDDKRYSNKSFEWRTEGTGPGSTGILTRIRNGRVEDTPTEVCTEAD